MKRRDFLEKAGVLVGAFVCLKPLNGIDQIIYDTRDGDYDESNIAVKDFDKCINDLEKSTYTIITEFKGRRPKFLRGLAHKNYIFTVNHGVTDKKYARKKSGIIVDDEAIELEDFYLNKKQDIGIFKCPALIFDKFGYSEWFRLKTCPFNLGDASKLKKGDFLFTVAGLKESTYREGKVSALEKNFVLSDLESYPGDSGSPLVALHDGEPHIIGITKGWREHEWFYKKGDIEDKRRQIFHVGIKINEYKKRI